MNNEDLIYSFFNQYAFAEVKANIQNIEHYYATNINTVGNPLIKEFLGAIKTYNFENVDAPLFQSILMRCGKTEAEGNQILGEIIKWKSYSKDQMQPALKYIKDIVAADIVHRANTLYPNSANDFLKYLKNVDVNTSDIDTFTATSFDNIDINTIIAESGNSVIKTNVDFINRSFPSAGGIERGQLGIICMPPGTGKTLFSMDLALYMATQGEKVLYISCADMNMKDFIVRMGSIAFGISFAESYRNLKSVYDQLKQMVGNNLEISINAGGTVSGDDIVEKTLAGDYSVVFIDYDEAIEGMSDGDSMYNTFGDLYNNLTKLSISGKLVLVCSQPKVFVYDKVIGLGDLSSSSRKAQIADFILTVSNVNPECPNHLYIMSLPKARRGRVGAKCYVIRINGRFIEIPKGVYDMLRAETEEKNYSESDINMMINNFNKQYGSRLQQPQQEQKKSNMKNPFES